VRSARQTKNRKRRAALVFVALFAFAITAAAPVIADRVRSPDQPNRNANIAIHFGEAMHDLGRRAIGMAESGYLPPNVLANDRVQQEVLERLDLGTIRMHLE
jgi:hypothetical protein